MQPYGTLCDHAEFYAVDGTMRGPTPLGSPFKGIRYLQSKAFIASRFVGLSLLFEPDITFLITFWESIKKNTRTNLNAIVQFIFFPVRALKSVEQQAEAGFDQYFGYFLLMLFWPIGIWWIQPKLNRIGRPDEEQLHK